MTTEQFNKIASNTLLVQPNYKGYEGRGFRILTVNYREGIIEINEPRFFGGETSWYRYENLSFVTYHKVVDENYNIGHKLVEQ